MASAQVGVAAPEYNRIYHGVTLASDGVSGWAVALDGLDVLRTTDGGQTWHTQDRPYPTLTLFDVHCVSANEAWTSGLVGIILHTSDGGNHWLQESYGYSKFLTRLDFQGTELGWAAGGDGVVARTTDGGKSWQQIFTGRMADYYGVSFVDTLRGWFCAGVPVEAPGGQGYIVRTTDGGLHYTVQRKDTVYDFMDIAFADSLTGWVVGGIDTSDVGLIMRSTDGGQNWMPQSAPGIPFQRAVQFLDAQRGWSVGRLGTILHTSDGGEAWIPQATGTIGTIFDVEFIDSLRGLAAGDSSALLYTTDGGGTWIQGHLPPVILPVSTRYVSEGETLSLVIDTNYPHPDSLTLTAGPLPPHAEFIDNGNNTGLLTFMPDETQAGTYDIPVIAGDGMLADTASVRVSVLETGVAGGGEGLPNRAGRLVALEAAPNPSQDCVVLRLSSAGSEPGRVDIYDLSGRRIFAWDRIDLVAGRGALIWGGGDDGGKRMPSGVYWARFRSGAQSATQRLILVR
jgi:photosystem II stability/assembly factor-like uncharacterized protein